MPTEAKYDPFKPITPAIPGVPADDPNRKRVAPSSPKPSAPVVAAPRPTSSAPRPRSSPTDDSNRRMIAIAACLTACLLLAVIFITTSLLSSSKPAAPSTRGAATPTADVELSAGPRADSNVPVAPGVIATTAELAKPWSSKRFNFRDPITGSITPALAVRLPNGSYWGFSMLEPYGTCHLEFVTDLEKLRSAYGFRADHPMVGDPCQHAVYDLLQYGGASNAEVRGALVHGMGVRPPLAIEIEQQGKEISALRME